jgi:hypothetical protein
LFRHSGNRHHRAAGAVAKRRKVSPRKTANKGHTSEYSRTFRGQDNFNLRKCWVRIPQNLELRTSGPSLRRPSWTIHQGWLAEVLVWAGTGEDWQLNTVKCQWKVSRVSESKDHKGSSNIQRNKGPNRHRLTLAFYMANTGPCESRLAGKPRVVSASRKSGLLFRCLPSPLCDIMICGKTLSRLISKSWAYLKGPQMCPVDP